MSIQSSINNALGTAGALLSINPAIAEKARQRTANEIAEKNYEKQIKTIEPLSNQLTDISKNLHAVDLSDPKQVEQFKNQLAQTSTLGKISSEATSDVKDAARDLFKNNPTEENLNKYKTAMVAHDNLVSNYDQLQKLMYSQDKAAAAQKRTAAQAPIKQSQGKESRAFMEAMHNRKGMKTTMADLEKLNKKKESK